MTLAGPPTLGDVLLPLWDRLGPLSVPRAAAAIRHQFDGLPAAVTRYAGFECHASGDLDAYVSIAAGSEGHQILAGTHASGSMRPGWFLCDRWRRVREFATQWSFLTNRPESNVFLGFDRCPDAAADIPSPFLHARTEGLALEATRRLAALVMAPDVVPDHVNRCLSIATPTFVGTRFGTTPTLRVTQPLPVSDVTGYLRGVGWPGSMPRVEAALARMLVLTSHVGVSLNVGPVVSPYLGLEFLNWTKPVSGMGAWRDCLDWLVSAEWMSGARRNALLAWPGLLAVEPDRSPLTELMLICRLHHVKLTLPPEGPTYAKVYVDAAIAPPPRRAMAALMGTS